MDIVNAQCRKIGCDNVAKVSIADLCCLKGVFLGQVLCLCTDAAKLVRRLTLPVAAALMAAVSFVSC